jgi:hypothetical protein
MFGPAPRASATAGRCRAASYMVLTSARARGQRTRTNDDLACPDSAGPCLPSTWRPGSGSRGRGPRTRGRRRRSGSRCSHKGVRPCTFLCAGVSRLCMARRSGWDTPVQHARTALAASSNRISLCPGVTTRTDELRSHSTTFPIRHSLRLQIPPIFFQLSSTAFFTALVLNLTSLLLEESAPKRQLALLSVAIKGRQCCFQPGRHTAPSSLNSCTPIFCQHRSTWPGCCRA